MSSFRVVLKVLEVWLEKLKFEAPIPTLRDSIEQKQWFSGIVLGTAFFEVWGVELLKEHFKGKISEDKLENLRLEEVILLLYSSEIIDQPTYTRIMEVKEVRNKVVHNPYELFELDKPESLVEKAIDCLKALGLPDEKEDLNSFSILSEK